VVPPPPPAMAPSKDAMYTLPKDPRVCPICRQKIVNPAMVSRTGIVSCYRCLFLHIEQHSSCPVTGRGGVTKHDVRRLISG
jgi:peroxin-12